MQQAISLLELNQLIRGSLEENLLPSYWIIAEIAELKLAMQGHAYLDLVEKNGNQIFAKLRANIWSYSYRTISGKFQMATGEALKSGMKILTQVSVTFHEVYGISLNIKDIDPNYTVGERARIRQEVIDKLTREGLMDLNKRIPLPLVPQRIAVISSASAAGYGDFMSQLQNNPYGYQVYFSFFQATLQGAEAVLSIQQAFEKIKAQMQSREWDAVVLIRGGGAQLDLDCFDDFGLAVSIATCDIPVITGIGHERDETIADMVAHTRMKTPTAVAEFILSGFRDFESKLLTVFASIEKSASRTLQIEDRNLNVLESAIRNSAKYSLQKAKEKITTHNHSLKSIFNNRLNMDQYKLQNLELGLRKSWKNYTWAENKKLENLQKDLQKLDPNYLLDKGYTRTEVNGIGIHQTKVKVGDTLITFGKNQSLKSIVQNIENHGEK